MVPINSVDLLEEDIQLQYQIRGKRLLCEVPFDRNLIETLRDALFSDVGSAWQYPNVSAVVTVGIGIYWYKSGTLWESFPHLSSPNETAQWGREFERFLAAHPTLESFRFLAEEGHRYVAPILAHGGVPFSCLHDLFTVTCRYCTHDQNGTEALEYLNDHAPALRSVTKPVRRFLSHGGESAEELLSRLLALWRAREGGIAEGMFGLPERIVDSFDDWFRNAPVGLRSGKRLRFPSPAIRLDPRLMTIRLSLPVCLSHPDAAEEWIADGRKYPSDILANISIKPASAWEVSCGKRHFRFERTGADSDLLFFEPGTGRMIRDPARRRLPEQVWALMPSSASSDPAPDHIESFLPWEGHSIAAFQLTGKSRLSFGDSVYEVRRPFFALGDQPIVENARSAKTGVPIFAETPRIEWEGKANVNLTKDGVDQGNDDISSEELVEFIDEPGEFRIDLRGPLGSNHRFEFLYSPGLMVCSDPSLFLPDSASVKWEVSAPAARATWQGEEGPEFVSHLPSVSLQIEYPEKELEILASVPKLEWGLAQDDPHDSDEWVTDPIAVGAKSLRSLLTAPVFACRLPIDPLENTVRLLGEQSKTQIYPKHISVQGEVFWHFNLGEVRDLLIFTGKSERFDLLVTANRDSRVLFKGRAIEIRPEWDIRDLTAEWASSEGGYSIKVAWTEFGESVEGKWLDIRSVWRPFDAPLLQCELPHGETRTLEWEESSDRLSPGRYMVSAVHAPWGLDDDDSVDPQQKVVIDVHPEIWPDHFADRFTADAVGWFTERMLAHCYRPERVDYPTAIPAQVTAEELVRFMKWVSEADRLDAVDHVYISELALDLFCLNPSAASAAGSENAALEGVPGWIRPPVDLVSADLGVADVKFLFDLMLNYRELSSEKRAKSVAMGHRPRSLCEVLRRWRKDLLATKKGEHSIPPLGHLIFLCEKFDVTSGRSPAAQAEYRDLLKEFEGNPKS